MNNLPNIKGQYIFDDDLSKYSWFKTGGIGKVVFFPKDKNDLVYFLKNFKQKEKIKIIGNGSNLLIRDVYFDGIIIILKNLNNIKIENDFIVSECGALNGKFFSFVKNNNIAGYEFLGTIPGTIGGACKMNAGCYGSDISNVIYSIKAVDLDGNEREYFLEDCKFEYRKNNLPKNLIFIEAKFKIINHKQKEEIEKIFSEMIEKRKQSQPVNEKTCGSTFKNLKEYPAWKVIQELGFQGIEYNGVKMSEKHANFLINISSKSSANIENLIKIIQDKAKIEKNIDLELEIQII